MWTVHEEPVDSPNARTLLRDYMRELVHRYNGRPMPESEVDYELEQNPSDGIVAFVIARVDGIPAGCAGLRQDGALTRMYVATPYRRQGGGRLLLSAVEDAARARGLRRLRIDTRDDLVEARALYTAAGYAEVEPFNHDPYAEHWFEKPLA